jgi:hypothetical protein
MRKPHSFDIFDTLIARRCVEPKNIFFEVEKAVNLAGFANLRIKAEASVAAKPYTLDDIYRVFVEQFGFNAETAGYLKAKEIELELHNVIAIKENLEAVENGDVLVTDMYLPRSAIMSLLDKVGLRKQVGLVISSSGKHSGDIWSKLKLVAAFEQHCGDNRHSDVASPLASGIYAEHIANSGLSLHENFFRMNGFELLARAVRETRLTCLSTQQGSEANQQALLQINNNIPLLLLTSVYLNLLSKKIGATNILFSSRDCYYLSRIFNLLREKAGWSVASEYFYTSRMCRISPSDSYLKYFKARASSNTLVVDLCGTGWSLGHLYQKAGVSPHTFLLHNLSATSNIREQYQQIRKSEEAIAPLSLLDGVPLDNSHLEMANYIDSGMVLDVLVVDGYDSVVPVLEYPNYPKSAISVLRNIEVTQEVFANVLEHFDLAALVREIEASADKLGGVVVELYKHLCENAVPMRDVALYHVRQDRKTMWKLKN